MLIKWSSNDIFDWCRHRWTGRYEAHLWDNSCRREGQARKGRQGIFFSQSIWFHHYYNLSWHQELQSVSLFWFYHIMPSRPPFLWNIFFVNCPYETSTYSEQLLLSIYLFVLTCYSMWSKWDLRRVNYRTRVLSKKLNARFKRSFTFIFILLICLYLYMMIEYFGFWRGAKVFFFNLAILLTRY